MKLIDGREFCQDYGDAGAPWCKGEVDERFTMDFTDVEPGALIKWCSACGPIAHRMQAAIEKAFDEREGFAEEFRTAIENAEAKQRENAS